MSSDGGSQPRTSTGAAVATGVLYVGMYISVLIGFVFSGFFVMATDSCQDSCNTTPLKVAYAVTYTGLGLAALGAPLASALVPRRVAAVWAWPLLGIILVVVAVMTGASIAGRTGP